MGQVIRASTPPRGTDDDEYRQTLWRLRRHGDMPVEVSAEIIALTDAIELQLTYAGVPRPRLRFLRDGVARSFANRIHDKLVGRGYAEASPGTGENSSGVTPAIA